MSKKFFFGRKILLKSGREVDVSCEEEQEGVLSILAILNHFDVVHEITKPLSIRAEWASAESDPLISIECRGGAPRDNRPVSESELPVEGLNGFKDSLHLGELQELLDTMCRFHRKVRQEQKI